MKGLKIIPIFAILLSISYLGMLFVEANREQVIISFMGLKTAPLAMGLVVLSSILLGMIVCGLLCSVELFILMMQNRSLRKKLPRSSEGPAKRQAPQTAAVATKKMVFQVDEDVRDEEPTAIEPTPEDKRFTPL